MLRGTAILFMIVFHFSFDLNYFRVISVDFLNDPPWPQFRILIVSMFLLIMGMSLQLATRHGLNRRSFLRRLLLLLLYAGLVTVGSRYLFPESYIWFGILHFIALASVLGLLFVRLNHLNLALGVAIVLLGALLELPFFDQPALQWIGMMTHLPYTEDYVPLVPWFGVVLLGIYLGRQVFERAGPARLMAISPRHLPGRTLALAGRHSLHIYILHQPVLLGILALLLG